MITCVACIELLNFGNSFNLEDILNILRNKPCLNTVYMLLRLQLKLRGKGIVGHSWLD